MGVHGAMRKLVHTMVAILATAAAAQAIAATPAKRKPTLDRQVTSAMRLATSAQTRATRALRKAQNGAPAGDAGFPGDAGPPGPPGDTGAPGAQGTPGASYVTADLPSKATITGAWGGRLHRPSAGGPTEVVFPVGFARAAPETIGDENVGFPQATPNVPAADQLPTKCTGTIEQPTAAPGFVCLYLNPDSPINLNGSASLTGKALDTKLSGADRYGFTVHVVVKDPGDTPATVFRVEGTWAYTAP